MINRRVVLTRPYSCVLRWSASHHKGGLIATASGVWFEIEGSFAGFMAR